MKNKKIVGDLFWGIVSDIPIPRTGTAKAALDSYQEKRRLEARKILLKEIKEGDVPLYELAQKDEFIAILYRYSVAVWQGKAAHNLRLLARVIGNQVSTGKSVQTISIWMQISLKPFLRRKSFYLGLCLGTTGRMNSQMTLKKRLMRPGQD